MVQHELRLRLFVAGLAGVVAWSGPALLIPVSLTLPVVCGRQTNSRRSRWLIGLAYYLAALWPLTAAGVQLYGWGAIPFLVVVSFAVASMLAAAWLIPGTVFPLILTAIPPLGIVGVAHPIASAGILFPGTGWIGVLAALSLPAWVVRRPSLAVPAAFASALLLNAIATESKPPTGWQAINTEFGDIRDRHDRTAEFLAAAWIQQAALASNARVMVFPELAVTRWTEATDAFWQPTLDQLAAQHRTLLIGAGLPIQGSQDYQNVLIAVPFPVGDETAYVAQSIPLPWAMWNPTAAKDRVPLNLWGRRTIAVSGESVGALICYEQLIPWPVFAAVSERPTVLLAISNGVWTRRTPIPAVQKGIVKSWSRLFGVPVLIAVNQ
jgi:Carbon-nitrogen hydrolase